MNLLAQYRVLASTILFPLIICILVLVTRIWRSHKNLTMVMEALRGNYPGSPKRMSDRPDAVTLTAEYAELLIVLAEGEFGRRYTLKDIEMKNYIQAKFFHDGEYRR